MSKSGDFLSNFSEAEITDMDRNYAKALGIKLPDDGWDLENAHKNPFKSKDGIENPSDGGGQGNDPSQSKNPYYDIITNNGYNYSHSTPVVHGDFRINHHTYKNAKGQSVSVWHGERDWTWEFTKTPGSGRAYRGTSREDLQKKLSGKDPEKQHMQAQLRKAKAQFAKSLNDETIVKLEGKPLEVWQAKLICAHFLGASPDATRLPRDYRWLGNIEYKGSKAKVMLYNDAQNGYEIKLR
jgi:hypothetical protein